MTLIKDFQHRLTLLRTTAALFTALVLLITACSPRNPPPTPAAARPSTPTPFPPPPADTAGQTWLHPLDEMILVFVPAGPFQMGSAADNPVSDETESPIHTVDLRAFWIDQMEVTNRMYSFCVQEGGCTPPELVRSLTRPDYYENLEFAEHPVVNITWQQAMDYCSWTGRRLPTEAEWEKAARGTDSRTYPWGEEPPDCSRLMFGDPVPGAPSCGDDTLRSGSLPSGSSPYGALDMAGNVWEWTADYYDPNWYAISPQDNPTGPASGDTRVLRGGSFSDSAETVRTANRHHTAPENASYLVGFRCAVSAP